MHRLTWYNLRISLIEAVDQGELADPDLNLDVSIIVWEHVKINREKSKRPLHPFIFPNNDEYFETKSPLSPLVTCDAQLYSFLPNPQWPLSQHGKIEMNLDIVF